MVLYVDVLLVINYLVNMLLLSCHRKLSGHKPRRLRLVLAALTGAAGSLAIFLPLMGFTQSALYKLTLSALVVYIATGFRGFIPFLKDWLLFFVVSFLFAGGMLACWMLLRPAGMLYYNGVVYFDISSVTLLLVTTAAYLLLGLFWRVVRGSRVPERYCRMTVRYSGEAVSLEAFVDSGNHLYEPFSGSPVVICRYHAIRPLFSREVSAALESGDYEKAAGLGMKTRFVPYNGIGGGGILPAFRADQMILGQGTALDQIEDAFLAISFAKLEHDALLHPDLARIKHGIGGVMDGQTKPEGGADSTTDQDGTAAAGRDLLHQRAGYLAATPHAGGGGESFSEPGRK